MDVNLATCDTYRKVQNSSGTLFSDMESENITLQIKRTGMFKSLQHRTFY